MLRIWEKPLTEEDKARIVARAASEIKKRRLETPAILFLEMHKPLANVAGHAAIAFSPFIMPFLGFKTVDEYSQFFSERANVELLIQALEDRGEKPPETSS
jgi:hypothetical protein